MSCALWRMGANYRINKLIWKVKYLQFSLRLKKCSISASFRKALTRNPICMMMACHRTLCSLLVLCWGSPPVTGGFPSQRAGYAILDDLENWNPSEIFLYSHSRTCFQYHLRLFSPRRFYHTPLIHWGLVMPYSAIIMGQVMVWRLVIRITSPNRCRFTGN